MNPNNPQHLARLTTAVDWSRKRLEAFRVQHFRAVRQYAGHHYGEGGSTVSVPVNLLYQMVTVYLRQLASRTPRVMASTRYAELKPLAYQLETFINYRSDRLDLGRQFKRVTLDALFGLGMAKVGTAGDGGATLDDGTPLARDPYVLPIHLDDAVLDMRARCQEELGYAGHRYRVSIEEARDNAAFDKIARESLEASSAYQTNEGGDQRIDTIGRGTEYDPGEYDEFTELWDLWLPREKLVVTVPAGHEGAARGELKPLRVVEWQGPENGPYHYLGFSEVPGNLLPTAPVPQLLDLHLIVNGIYRKLHEQAERQKTLTVYQGSAEDDARRRRDARDGEMVRTDQAPDKVLEVRHGGPDQANAGFMALSKDLFNLLAGNLEVIGGLGAQAETATQEQMIGANSSKQIQDLQDRCVTFARGVYRDMAWYWWTDPVQDLEADVPIGNSGMFASDLIGQPLKLLARQRELHHGRFLDLNFDIQPYSMQYQTPQTQLQSMMALVQQLLLPLAGLAEQQGVTLSVKGLLEKAAHHMGQKDLAEFIVHQDPTEAPGRGPHDEPPRKPPATTRTYVRQGRPGVSPGGNDRQMATEFLRGAGANGTGVKSA